MDKLAQMSFLEAGVGKKVLTAIFQEFVEKDINAESKAKYMEIISDFYIEILMEFYTSNSGFQDLSKSDSDQSISEKKVGSAFEKGLLDAVHEKEDAVRTVFEKVINELRNIEYAVQYYVKIAEQNEKTRPSQIETNATLHLFDSPLFIPKKPKLPLA